MMQVLFFVFIKKKKSVCVCGVIHILMLKWYNECSAFLEHPRNVYFSSVCKLKHFVLAPMGYHYKSIHSAAVHLHN